MKTPDGQLTLAQGLAPELNAQLEDRLMDG